IPMLLNKIRLQFPRFRQELGDTPLPLLPTIFPKSNHSNPVTTQSDFSSHVVGNCERDLEKTYRFLATNSYFAVLNISRRAAARESIFTRPAIVCFMETNLTATSAQEKS